MIQDVTLHGHITPNIECYAVVAGRNVANRYFYEQHTSESGMTLRVFSSGFELALTPEGLRYKGPGGSVGEYMFGVDQPVRDLVKKEVLNRLVMFGTYYGRDKRKLVFSNQSKGSEDYHTVFMEGNAVANYYVLIPSSFEGEVRHRQEYILRKVGKMLKRTPLVGRQDDVALAHAIHEALEEPDTVLYLFRLVNLIHMRYRNAFLEIYKAHAFPKDEDMRLLEDLAAELGVEHYQQQRIRMDVIYKHEENQKLVETYKDVLIASAKEGLTRTHQARLQRLRTLSLRYNVPSSLLDTLDELLLEEETRVIHIGEEADYVERTRQILESLFLGDQAPHTGITAHDIKELLTAKRRATEEHNNLFEQVLLDTGRACDEAAAESGDLAPLENLGNVVTYLDRFDSTLANVNQLAFMDGASLPEDKVRSLLGNKKAIDELEPGFFEALFLKPLVENKYVPLYGRRKVATLRDGLKGIEEGAASLGDLANAIAELTSEERLYRLVHETVKQHIRSFYYSDLRNREAIETLRQEVSTELRQRGLLEEDVSAALFDKVVLDIRKEAFYVQQLLPQIIERKNTALREDFILNSGLDRFYIEELESEYLRAADVSETVLASLREAAL